MPERMEVTWSFFIHGGWNKFSLKMLGDFGHKLKPGTSSSWSCFLGLPSAQLNREITRKGKREAGSSLFGAALG